MKQGKNCQIGDDLKILGYGEITLGNNVKVGDNITINVSERLIIGDRSIIGDHFIIEGRDIKLGTEFWSGHHCQIGGGSCFEKRSMLRVGYWCHLGNFSFINTSRQVKIGNEVGMGTGTKIYTHGAYLSFLDGFPVEFGPITIGDHVWLPGATVLSNVEIGDNVVVGVGAIITKDIPAGSLAVGTPARVIKENCYPKTISSDEKRKMVEDFITCFTEDVVGKKPDINYDEINNVIILHGEDGIIEYNVSEKQVHGNASLTSERLRNELRRYGVRFKSYPKNGVYISWRTQDIIVAIAETQHLEGDLVEAGVYTGNSAKIICEVKGNKPLHLFDTFEGLPESMFEPIDSATELARRSLAPGRYAGSLFEVKENLKQYKNVFYYPGIFPETAKPLKNKTFAFVHLDLDLYRSTLEALRFFYPRLNVEGIIISHNYTDLLGVKKAFDEFFKDKPEKINVISSSQCLIKKS